MRMCFQALEGSCRFNRALIREQSTNDAELEEAWWEMLDACEVFRDAALAVEEAHVLQYMGKLLCGQGIQVLWFNDKLREEFVEVFEKRRFSLQRLRATLEPPLSEKLALKLALLKEAADEIEANIKYPPRQ